MSIQGTHLSDNADNELQLMSQLREILLKEDRFALMEVQQILKDRELLSIHVNPIIEEHLTFLKQNFPKEFNKDVNKLIEQKLKDSQQEILEVVYPVMGKMISKFISLQFQELKESIDAQINNIFSKQGLVKRFRNKIFGVKDADIIIASLDKPVLEEIFIIQRETGLMLGNASLSPSVNRDVVAGMLTAIKAFVEEAFVEHDKEDLEMIQYGTYRILLQNFPSYYFAMALSGSVSTKETEVFRNKTIDFIEKTTSLRFSDVTSEIQDRISQELENEFIVPQREKQKVH
jgi:hypothetical protein